MSSKQMTDFILRFKPNNTGFSNGYSVIEAEDFSKDVGIGRNLFVNDAWISNIRCARTRSLRAMWSDDENGAIAFCFFNSDSCS
jgi:hypothetical protein